jgi:hypothetical protein
MGFPAASGSLEIGVALLFRDIYIINTSKKSFSPLVEGSAHFHVPERRKK